MVYIIICKLTCSRNYIPMVLSSLNYTSLPSTVATFLITCLMAVLQPSSVKTTESGLSFYYFLFYFYFSFDLCFSFSIFRTLELGLEVIDHISHIWWYGHNINHGTWEKVVEGSRTSDIIQYGYYMLTSCTTHGCLG